MAKQGQHTTFTALQQEYHLNRYQMDKLRKRVTITPKNLLPHQRKNLRDWRDSGMTSGEKRSFDAVQQARAEAFKEGRELSKEEEHEAKREGQGQGKELGGTLKNGKKWYTVGPVPTSVESYTGAAPATPKDVVKKLRKIPGDFVHLSIYQLGYTASTTKKKSKSYKDFEWLMISRQDKWALIALMEDLDREKDNLKNVQAEEYEMMQLKYQMSDEVVEKLKMKSYIPMYEHVLKEKMKPDENFFADYILVTAFSLREV